MRTDKDTWDITTSVGSTALFVAAARALEAQKPDPLAVDPFAEVFCRAVGGDWADLLDGTAPGHPLKTEFGTDFVNYQGARTKYFDAYFRDAANAGVRQIVLLAAGLDSRGYRLDWPDGTVIFELDQPQVLAFKRKVLADKGFAPSAERREIAVDLRADWPRALRDSGFDASAPSAWVAEGLLIYLPAAAQQELFAGVNTLACSGSQLALEEAAPMDAAAFEAARDEERKAEGNSGGPFFQLIYNEQHEPADQWFGGRGWTVAATPLRDYLASVGRPAPRPGADAGPMFDTMSLVRAIKQ